MAGRIGIAAAGLALAFTFHPAAADFEAGLEAYGRGDHRAAFETWSADAAQGDPVAQWLVGNMLLSGEGGAGPDPAAAASFYERAASQGYVEAQVSLGTLYRLGRGVAQDYRSALTWLYEAAAKKHPTAQMDLGDLFLSGVPGEVQADPSHAFEWYRLAARQGVVLGQFKLGQLYTDGVGTKADPVMGLAWLGIAARAAEEGLESAASRRVMGLRDQVATDPERRTLADIIKATYRTTRLRFTSDVIARAEARAANYDPSEF